MIGSDFDDFRQRYDDLHANYWSNRLSLEDLRDWYQERLRTVVAHVQQHSPFYRERLRKVDASGLTLERLRDLPFTTRDDLRDSMLAILSGKLSDAISYYESSGISGSGTPCPRDKKESYANNIQLSEAWRRIVAHHFPDTAPVVGIIGPTETNSLGDTLRDVCFRLGVCNARIWPNSMVNDLPKCIQSIRDLCPGGMLVSSPGMLLALAREAERLGYDPVRDFAVRAVMMIGELCTPALKNNIRSLWGAEPYNSLYGSEEALVIAATDRQGRLVPHRLNYIFEVLDPATGASKGECGDGELCVTMLIDGVKPLIRYRTGDLVSIQATGSTSLTDALTMSVAGRVQDRIVLNDRSLTAGELEQAVMDGITLWLGYHIVIGQTGGRDSLIVELEMSRRSTAAPRNLIADIRDRVRARLGCEAMVMLVDGPGAPRIDPGGWIGWKETRITDQRSPVGDAALVPAR